MATATATVHSVHFYDSDSSLIQRLQGVVASGLRLGSSVLIVATRDHRHQLTSELEKTGVDLRAAHTDGRWAVFDAAETLSQFMVNGLPDRDRFFRSVGQLVIGAREAAQSPSRGLTVFGEMVSLLWTQGNKAGALALEGLWNDLLHQRGFHLHCAYPRAAGQEDLLGFAAICEHHSHLSLNGSAEVGLRTLV